jgi:hypothetical protein
MLMGSIRTYGKHKQFLMTEESSAFLGNFMNDLVFLLGIFRRAPHPGGALPLKKIFFLNLLVIYDTSSIREPPKVS